MRALWAAPPAVLIAGSVAASVQLRRIAVQRSLLAEAARTLGSDRSGLRRLSQASAATRASLEGLERR
jgi:hypothetical protein